MIAGPLPDLLLRCHHHHLLHRPRQTLGPRGAHVAHPVYRLVSRAGAALLHGHQFLQARSLLRSIRL